ncbi:Hypothetical protein A7982_00036 [Minicystis rosea]|nr:Hypothetical protein A7982_00036 [Minicystis rosea]
MGRLYHREIDTRCGAGGRTSVVALGDYDTITGRHRYDVDSDPDLRDTFKGPILFPKAVLGVITLARGVGEGNVSEITVYADGWLLWIKGVKAESEQFPTARLHIIDRRYLTARDERWFRDTFKLTAEVALDDDEALRRALRKLPSVPPGKTGQVPGPW